MSDAVKRRLTPEDLYRFVLVGYPEMAPDGEHVAFVRSRVDPESKEYHGSIWLADTEGGHSRPFTRGQGTDSDPCWSPDGRYLAFVRRTGDDDHKTGQVWIIARAGGEAWPLTTMKHGAGNPLWSPDGRYLAFQAAVGDGETDGEAIRTKTAEERKFEDVEVRDEGNLITHFRYKSDTRGIHRRLTRHIWVVDVPETPASDEKPDPVRVTKGDHDFQLLDWSPDGKRMAVSRAGDDERAMIQDVWVFPVQRGDESGAPLNVTGGTGVFTEARWSPAGDKLAVVGHRREYETATLSRLWLYPADGRGESPLCVTKDWDRGLGGTLNSDLRPGGAGAGLTWDRWGKAVYFLASDRGVTGLYRVDSEDGRNWGQPTRVGGGSRDVYGCSLVRESSQAALAVAEMTSPGDIVLLDLATGAERRLTDVNASLTAEVAWPEWEEIHLQARDGLALHGWILKPVDFEPGQRCPGVLQIHGGPHTCYGHSFMLEFQLQAALGYAVIFTNPRGSTGYGQDFVRGCQGDYGGDDYEDLMDAVDHAISLGYVDANRLVVTGGSYGGFMTNWIVGHTSRFKAGIAHRSISNWISFWGVSDIGPGFLDGEFTVDSLWAGLDELWDRSPLKYVGEIETPLLICHSENDLRCPIEQAEQLYVAMKWQGKDVEFLRHPRSNHELTRSGPPVLRVDRFHHIERFLKRYVPVTEG